MGSYSSVYLGRIVVREDLSVSEKSDGTLALTGQESMPKVTKLDVERRRADLAGMAGEIIPVYFGEKTALDGFYLVDDTGVTLTEWDGTLATAAWTANLTRLGYKNEIDLESRLSGTLTRVNEFSATGKRWHAPAVNHLAYWAGTSSLTYASRVGTEGTLKVYQQVPDGVNPRWGVTPADYLKGRVRFIDQNGYERHGRGIQTSGTSWELSNSLLRIKPSTTGATLEIASYTGTVWNVKNWAIKYGTSPVTTLAATADYVSVIWNTLECVVLRLTSSVSTMGRITVDITLRRGASFAEVYVQHEFGTTLQITRSAVEAATAGTGYIVATNNDANGHKYILGSAKSFTGDVVNGGISKTTTPTLDAIVGVQLDATSGNAAADLYQQYLGSPAEYVQAVRR